MLHRGKWRHSYPCTQLCAHNSDRTEHVSLLTVLPRALSSVPAFLAARKNVSFHRLLSNFSGLDLVLICTVSEVHMLLLEQLGEGLGGGFFLLFRFAVGFIYNFTLLRLWLFKILL